jgi:eukaryotic-like serine/threonine-protein kinase
VALSPGQTIAPNLRLARMLGEGGMGSVWVADHLTLRTQVAVKFVAARLVDDVEVLARFSQEATAAARIKSPYVVQVLDHGVFEGTPYIAMELLEGEDLSRRLERGALGPGELGAILNQACKGLAAAHALGIVHRDIKPANLFLTQSAGELVVKVLDFGIAKQTNAADPSFKTSTRSLVGTPFYMSPEQIFSKGAVDCRADLWALAVVVYECLTGVLPFQGDALGDLYVAIHAGNYRPASSFPRVDLPGIDAWFSRGLARDAAARFGSARELADAFLALVSTGGARADFAPIAATSLSAYTTPSSLPTRPSLPRRFARLPLVHVAAGALVAVGLSGATWVALHRYDARAQAGVSPPIDALPPSLAAPQPSLAAPPPPPLAAPEPTVVPGAAITATPSPSATPVSAPAKSAAVRHAPAAPADTVKKHNYGF